MLPLGYKTVLNLYAIEGYSHKEIASILEIEEGTSRSQYARAKIMLEIILIKRGVIDPGNLGNNNLKNPKNPKNSKFGVSEINSLATSGKNGINVPYNKSILTYRNRTDNRIKDGYRMKKIINNLLMDDTNDVY
jgi:DNA-binding CsgD family transcriptional regulator